jgi:Fe(3+) dicitrate transport protein
LRENEKMKNFVIPYFVFFLLLNSTFAQKISENKDSFSYKNLPDITIVGKNSNSDIQQMPEIVGTSIYAGKKSALIIIDNVQGNVVNNNMRQVLAKTPGIHVWESDPSGIQIGIAARGLSPNRSWEFNIRQNGYDIAADPFGYPEAYYNPQLQSVQRIEIVRGQGSLQYGPQFGGMVNYILKNGSEINKPVEFEVHQTIGSNALQNSYNAIGGKTKKINYYAFYNYRNGNGWRQNSRFFSNSGFITFTYSLTQKLSLTTELMLSHIRSQQAGGLTDAQFKSDAKQSVRNRNWFDITWCTPAVIINYNMGSNKRWITKLFATIGDRNSVGFTPSITISDSLNTTTGAFNNRNLLVDQYRNIGVESRWISDYKIGKIENTVSVGIRLYQGSTHRKGNGIGTNGADYDMTLIGNYQQDINFKSKNAAIFCENLIRFTKRISVIPGIRFETLEGEASGRNGIASNGDYIMLQQINRKRKFVLAGIGIEYQIFKGAALYSNLSQAYRPIQFANLQAPPTTDVIDPNLTDSKGYNFDLGYRGKIKDFLQFDFSIYHLKYNNRIGTITPSGANYRLVTNVGNTNSKGIESFFEFNATKAFKKNAYFDLVIFNSYSYNKATYSNDYKLTLTKGNLVENAPQHILRSGISFGYKYFLFTSQFNYVSESFSDANNTITATANGQSGLIPSYTIFDATLQIKLPNRIIIKSGINNLFNEKYFTRRAGGYPGPGVLPADGRTAFLSFGIKM